MIALFVSLLLVASCTAESEPSVAGDSTTAAPTTEPAPITEIEPTPEPTAAVVEKIEETAVSPEHTIEDPLVVFFDTLDSTLLHRDFDLLLSLMSDPVGFGNYRSEWQQLSLVEIRPLLENLLLAGANLQFSPAATDLPAMLDGQNPYNMLGPDVMVAAVWHTTGWGAEGQDEAILFVAETADGLYALKAILYAPNGFLPESAELPILDEQPAPVGLLYHKPDGSLWQVAADGQPVEVWSQEGTPVVPAPDGQHAFYQIQGDLWLLDVTTGESSQLTSDHDDQGTHLAGYHWWYDNNTILTGIWLDFESDGGPNFGRPALIDIVTGELTMVDSQHLMSSYPAISADGAIAYSSVQQSAGDDQTAWIYDPAAGVTAFAPTEYVGALDGFYTAPAWSSDGRSLAWLVSDGLNVQMVLFNLDSKTGVSMYAYQGAAFGGPYPNPIISPNGSLIALRQFTNDPATTGLWLYSLDGQEPLFIAHNGGESFWVNEHLLLFLDYDENFNAQLQQYDALTGTRSVVTLPEVFQIFNIIEP